MKNILISSLLVLFYGAAFSQKLDFQVQGTYERSVKKVNLEKAESLSDIIIGYPSSWITDYISAEITTTSNDKVGKALSANDRLTLEQKNLLSTADLGTDVNIEVTYRYSNSAIDQTDILQMNYSATVVPQIEAEYVGGNEQLKMYLKENTIDKISEADAKKINPAVVTFIINEAGEVANAQVSTGSGDEKIDKLLLKTIQKMPKWKPAENSDGLKVKQDFKFSVGMSGC
jgi:TonB family protein